jgi:phosphoglycerate dehydrogenase-like enzyme
MTNEDLQKLLKYQNCIIYPPIAYISEEAKKSKQEIFVSNIENFLSGNPQNKVN